MHELAVNVGTRACHVIDGGGKLGNIPLYSTLRSYCVSLPVEQTYHSSVLCDLWTWTSSSLQSCIYIFVDFILSLTSLLPCFS